MESVIKALRQKLSDDEILTNQLMSERTTFRIGGRAAVFVQPASREGLLHAVGVCREYKARFGVMGRGSNLLFPDYDFEAVIISTESLKAVLVSEEDPTVIKAEAGVLLKNAADFAWKHGLTGLEFACGIPGTIGGAVRMNAGAYGGDMSQIFYKAEILDADGRVSVMQNSDMNFAYRHSAVSEKGFLVLSAELRLTPGETADIKALMDKNMEARNSKQPVNFPSAGSVFKRPRDGVSAAGLIDECGLKGFSIGGAQVSEKHSGFIVNTGGASSEDVRSLIAHIRRVVKEQREIELEPEVIIIN